jgi:hypothetical protein
MSAIATASTKADPDSQACGASPSARKRQGDKRDCSNAVSPHAPVGLSAAAVAAGADLFSSTTTGGACQGCHGGAKWTVSRRFYSPSGTTNEALLTTAYDGAALTAAGFPSELLPAGTGSQFMRSPNPKSGAFDQIQCVLRPVGTFATSPAGVNVVELRADMVTAGQGNEAVGKGFNVPSLLGVQVGAPFFHAGNARTLEELLGDTFAEHHRALAGATYLETAADVDKLVQYLLSIDNDKALVAIPATPGATGGVLCDAP